jgi:CBS domain-containing protein
VHPDDTMRQAAYVMAERSLTRLPVVDREDPEKLLGVVSLDQLLKGRLRDLREAREAEQVLRFRLVLPTRRIARGAKTLVG